MDRSPRRRSSSAATGSSRHARKKRTSSGRRGRPSATARSRCGRSGRGRTTRPRSPRHASSRRCRRSRPSRSSGVEATRARIDAIWRIESGRVIANVAGLVRDVGLAEDLAQDAVVVALERWPSTGIPPNPGAWLTMTAKHRAIDLMRRDTTLQAKYAQIARDLGVASAEPAVDAELEDDIGDDLLSLMF